MFISQERLEKYTRAVIYIVFCLPLIITPGALFPYLYGKAVLFEILIGITAACLIAFSKNFWPKITPIFGLYAVFIAARLVTGFLGDNPEKSFWGDQMRMTGTFIFLFFFLFFILVRFAFRGFQNESRFLKAAAVSGVMASALALFQRFTSLGGEIFGKSDPWIFGSFGNPSYFSGYLLLIIFFTGLIAVGERRTGIKKICGLVLAIEAMILVATSSRGAIVGLLLGAAAAGAVLFYYSQNARVRAAGAAFVIFSVLIFSGSLAVFFSSAEKSLPRRAMGPLLRSATAETRIINWKIALDGFLAKPFLGWGPENYEIVFSKFYRPELINYSFVETWSDRPHNIVLEVADAGGILGILSFAGLIGVPLWLLLRRNYSQTSNLKPQIPIFNSQLSTGERAVMTGGVAAYLGQGLFLFDTFGAWLLFTALLAIIDLKISAHAKEPSVIFSAVKEKSSALIALGVFFRRAFSLVILGLVFFGAILPVEASRLADRVELDIAGRNFKKFKQDFRGAVNSRTPYHDELAKILADHVLKGDAAGKIPVEITKDILPEFAVFMGAAAESHPNVYALVLRSAQIFSLAGEYLDPSYFKKSEEMFDRLEALSPQRQTAAIMRIQMEIARGNYQEALGRAEILKKENSDFGEAQWIYGLALLASGSNDAAEEVFGQAQISDYLGTAQRINLVLDFYAGRGRYEKMAPLLLKWISANPDDVGAHMRLAAVYAALGKFDEARAAALKTVSLDPSRQADVEEFIGAVEDLSQKSP